jgi:hypothetical protein
MRETGDVFVCVCGGWGGVGWGGVGWGGVGWGGVGWGGVGWGGGGGGIPKIGFTRFLAEIEAHQGAAQAEGDGGAPNGIHQQGQKERRVDGVEDAGKGNQVHRGVQQAGRESQSRFRELPAATGIVRGQYNFLSSASNDTWLIGLTSWERKEGGGGGEVIFICVSFLGLLPRFYCFADIPPQVSLFCRDSSPGFSVSPGTIPWFYCFAGISPQVLLFRRDPTPGFTVSPGSLPRDPQSLQLQVSCRGRDYGLATFRLTVMRPTTLDKMAAIRHDDSGGDLLGVLPAQGPFPPLLWFEEVYIEGGFWREKCMKLLQGRGHFEKRRLHTPETRTKLEKTRK